MIETTIYQNNL